MKSRTFGALCALICTALPPVSSALTRDDIIATAESYLTHTWTAISDNVCVDHIDSESLYVDTPGWWSTSQANVGVPYKWGGSDTIATFDAGLSAGRCAGDINTSEAPPPKAKGRGSGDAVGVDCSGFVSRAWGLTAHFSTGRLPEITRLLRDANGTEDYSQLKRGDILNRRDSHVMLVATDSTENPVEVEVYEASAYDWKVSRRTHPIEYLRGMGYIPHSHFNPADVELIIDRSRSMLGQKLQAAQEASISTGAANVSAPVASQAERKMVPIDSFTDPLCGRLPACGVGTASAQRTRHGSKTTGPSHVDTEATRSRDVRAIPATGGACHAPQ